MLDSFYIKNFRLFKELTLPRLGRVTLLTGKNNTGKTAFLEAVRLYCSRVGPQELFRQLEDRNEFYLYAQQSEQFSDPESFRHLFTGRVMPINQEGISLGIKPNESQLHLRIKMKTYKGDIIQNGTEDYQPGLYIEYEDEQLKKNIGRIDESLHDFRQSIRFNLDVRFPFFRCRFVPSDQIGENALGNLWDSINLTALERHLVDSLQLIEPTIERIGFVNLTADSKEVSRIPIVKIKGEEKTIPLKSLGGGTIKVLTVMLNLVIPNNKILLIDEFENGLHWKLQPKVWDAVFRLSTELNVQVIATTHSWDCVKGFQSAWAKDEEAGAFIRFDRFGEDILPTVYDLETLTDAVTTDVEVR